MEERKALRIIAGILLIVLAVLWVLALLPSFFTIMAIDHSVGSGYLTDLIGPGYWIGFGQSFLTAFIGVMLLVRGFRTAGIAVIVYAASVIATTLGCLDASFRYTLIPITSASTVLFLCAAVLVTVLICIGLFLHDRRSMWPLIVSAILLPVIPFLLSASSGAKMEYLGTISSAGEWSFLALILDFLKSLPLAAASLLLGIRFGAQTRAGENA
jgi:hypothetical protein